MFIEVIYDKNTGNIIDCHTRGVMPINGLDLKFVERDLSPNEIQARINIDTLTAMEIFEAKKMKAGLDPQGNPIIIKGKPGAIIIKELYRVDTTKPALTLPVNVKLPPGLEMRELKKK